MKFNGVTLMCKTTMYGNGSADIERQEEAEYPVFEKGQKVKSVFGELLTVRYQNGCMVFVEERSLGHYHPTKLFPL
jgi:hypothetical protein